MAMATIFTALPSTKPVLGFQRSNIRPSDTSALSVSKTRGKNKIPSTTLLSFRFENAIHLQMRRRMPALFANPSEGDIVKEKAGGSDTGDTQGPPFLTILAGFVVFFLICWIVGSIGTWLISLIFNISPFK